MGKKKTTVGTSVNRVIDDAMLPGSVKTGVIKSILEGGEIVDYVLEELVNSIGLKAERMYEYAKSGDYPWGLPSGQFTSGEQGHDEVKSVLEAIEGAPVILDYAHHGPANNLHLGWMQLISTYGYNPATNQLASLSSTYGTTVWLKDMQVVIPAATASDIDPLTVAQWGVAAKAGYTPQRPSGSAATRALIKPTPVKLTTASSSESLLVTHTRMVAGSPVDASFTIALPLAGFDDDPDEDYSYFHARYLVGGVAKYWIYRDGSGTHPSLDGLFDRAPVTNGTFFPFLYFRFNKQSEVDDMSTEAYRTSKRMAKYLGMDYDQVGQAINENPDIDDVEQAMMMFAVPANTTNDLERRYLFEFFDNMYHANPVVNRYELETSVDIAGQLNADGQMYLAAPGLVIQDDRFKMALRNDRIIKRKVPGSIGPVGTYDSGYQARVKSMTVLDLVTGAPSVIDSPWNYHYYRKQLTAGLYEEIQVVDLRVLFYVFDQYKTIGDESDKILLIPIDRSITESWNIPDREILYARSMHYIFNSRVVTKVKWYETGIFKALMVVVSIVVTIYTLGTGAPAVMALLAAGNYAAAAILVLQAIVQFVLVTVAFKLFVKVVGFKVAFIVAIVAAIAGAGNFLDLSGLPGTPFAGDLLQVASGLARAVQEGIASGIEGLIDEAQAFQVYADKQMKLLDTAKDLLEGGIKLSPFVIFGESPDEYYNRTVHSGNIGVVVGIESISSFVEMKLTLPRLRDTTFEGFEYAG